MQTSRDDVGIAIRSAFLQKGTQQRFSLFALIIISVILIFFESVDAKPLNYFRAILKDTIYRGSALVSYPSKVISSAVKNPLRMLMTRRPSLLNLHFWMTLVDMLGR